MSCRPGITGKAYYLPEDRGYSTPCWIWQGSKNKQGYGKIKRGGKDIRAHRYFYEQAKGDIPVGMWVDHLCKQTSCVNPKHLEAVIPIINQRRGDQTPFTDADIVSIKSRYTRGESQHSIARSLGVRQGSISRIIRGERWNGVGVHVPTRSPIKLTSEQVQEIVRLCAMGTPQRDAAQLYGMSQSQISRIVRGECWS